jgi:lipopolysaccharide transport protein LptA
MDSFTTKRGAICAAFILLPCVLHAQGGDEPLTISIDAEFSSLDRQTNRGTFKGLHLVIEQENIAIEADEASVAGLDTNRGSWQLSGNVRMTIDTATLEADRASFVFGTDEFIQGELVGQPATFQDLGSNGADPVIGSAQRVYYSSAEGSVRMEGGVSLTAGPNRITGCDVIYDLNQERVSSGTSECGEPFRITIIPPAERASRSNPPVAP